MNETYINFEILSRLSRVTVVTQELKTTNLRLAMISMSDSLRQN
jgi:hypothetical protein